jgi:thiol-disulfide isomerase/thioredoxin
MRSIKLLFIHLLFFSSTSVFAQSSSDIQVMNFSQLEPLLHQSGDTVHVINFWATWCVPCRKELPEFEKLYTQYTGSAIKVLLVSLDFPKQIESSLIPFLQKNNITAPVLLLDDPNSNAWIDKVDPAWSGALPATLIYKDQSRVFFEQELNYDSLVQSINKLK